MIRVGIYPRVSTREQALKGYSIGEQIERLTNYCKAMKWEIYDTYTDPGYTGATTDRPGLQRLIKDIKQHKIDKVVVCMLDRLSRSQLDTLFLIEKVFIPNGVDFVSMSENFDTSTPFGRATLGILAVFAQLEREQIRERMSMGRMAKAREGYWSGSIPPLGYDYENKLLIKNEYQAMQIAELFTLFNQGVPLRDIETRFAEQGYTINGRPWRLFSIRYMITNKVYAGYVRCGNEWVPGVHEPIISIDTWESAQERMKINRDRFLAYNIQTNGDTHTMLLGGLVYCKRCGARYGKQIVGSVGKKHSNYCCYSRMKVHRQMVKDPDCRNKSYKEEQLDRIVCDEIMKLALDPSAIREKEKNEPDEKHVRVALEKQLKTVNSQISRFMDLYGLGRFTVEQLDQKIIPLEEQKAKLEKQIELISRDDVAADDALVAINSFPEIMQHGNKSEIRKVVESLINRIDIDGDDVYINWRF